MYTYVKDLKPCDTKGEGVGGVWFVSSPDGKKAKDKLAK
jgi:predicted lipoprotein with Yx(FWY)xxD motif